MVFKFQPSGMSRDREHAFVLKLLLDLGGLPDHHVVHLSDMAIDDGSFFFAAAS